MFAKGNNSKMIFRPKMHSGKLFFSQPEQVTPLTDKSCFQQSCFITSNNITCRMPALPGVVVLHFSVML